MPSNAESPPLSIFVQGERSLGEPHRLPFSKSCLKLVASSRHLEDMHGASRSPRFVWVGSAGAPDGLWLPHRPGPGVPAADGCSSRGRGAGDAVEAAGSPGPSEGCPARSATSAGSGAWGDCGVPAGRNRALALTATEARPVSLGAPTRLRPSAGRLGRARGCSPSSCPRLTSPYELASLGLQMRGDAEGGQR